MSDPGFTPPSPPPYTEPSSPPAAEMPRRSRRLRAIAVSAAAVIVAVAAAGGILAYRALHGSADGLVSMVPGDSALYVSINLDPPGGQKLAVQGLLNKFPALSDRSRTATVNGWLDTALSSTGLNHSDITPWLGSGIAIAVPASAVSSLSPAVGSRTSAPPGVSVLIASSDDGKAQAALDKIKTGPVGKADRWTTSTYGGVTVTSGTGHSSDGAYAITNHTVIFASSGSAVDTIIDTVQGKRANLQSSSSYRTVESRLPADRLGLTYIDVPAFVKQLGSSVASVPGAQAQLNAARAYRGFGVALVASSDGIALDGVENYDASQLTSDQRAMLGIAPHVNGTLAFVPKGAYGVLAFTALQQTLKSILTTVAPAGSALDMTLQQFGVTGSGGIVNHLSGDAGIEVEQLPGQTVPAGALLLHTDSTDAAQSFLDHLMSSLCGQTGACDPSQVTRQVDQGVTISSVPLTGAAGSGVEPAWAVSGGWAIIGSTPDEVRAALDSHASGSNITTSPAYRAVTSHVGASNNGMFYIDVHAVVSAIRSVLPADAQSSFDSSAAPYLNRLGAVDVSVRNASDHMGFTLFVQVR
jgi:Protein of unknown function (DUF3352)